MSLDPTLALQDVVGKTLAGALYCQVYDRVPATVEFPYCVIGDDHILTNDDYGDWSEAHVTVHIFSRSDSMTELKTLTGQARAALSVCLPVSGFNVYEYALEDSIFLTDPDGMTNHAVLTMSYSIRPTG